MSEAFIKGAVRGLAWGNLLGLPLSIFMFLMGHPFFGCMFLVEGILATFMLQQGYGK